MPGRARLKPYGALWFCYFVAMGTYSPFAPLWFKDLGFSTLAIGTIASLQSWTRVLAPYGWGWLGDHGGRRVQLIRLAAGGAVLASAGLLWARGYAAVAMCCVLLFVANGGIVPLAEASLSRHLMTDTGLDAARYGRVRVWGSVGYVASVATLGVLLQAAGIGVFPIVVVLTWTLLLVATTRLPATAEPTPDHDAVPPVWHVMRQPAVAWFFASIFFTVLAHTSMYTFLSLYLDSLGHGRAVVGLLWAVSAGLEVAFFWWQGRLFPRLSAHAWLQWAAALAVLRFAATAAFGGHVVLLVVVQALHAVTFAAQHAACIALISRHFPGALRGRGQALYSVLGYGSSGVVGGVAGGWLSTQFGFASVFWAASAVAALGWWCARRSLAAEGDSPA